MKLDRNPSENLLEARHLQHSFGDHHLLDDLSLRVGPGEIYALLGGNGAGKSTTLNIFLGFVQPTSGYAAVGGIDPSAEPDKARAQLAYVPENVALYEHLPKEETFDAFFVHHPEWRDTPPVTGRFHWKWYYAFHQVGDEVVAPQVAEYRDSLAARECWTQRVGWLLPTVATQVLLHRLADTDLAAQLAYQDSIAALHRRIRYFYYPYVFEEEPFTRADFEQLPEYEPRAFGGSIALGSLLALALAALAVLILGLRRARSIVIARSTQVGSS